MRIALILIQLAVLAVAVGLVVTSVAVGRRGDHDRAAFLALTGSAVAFVASAIGLINWYSR